MTRTRRVGSGATGVLYGVRSVLEALRVGRRRVLQIWVADTRTSDSRFEELAALAAAASVPLLRATRHEIERRATSASHQGVVASVDPLPTVGLDALGGDRGRELAIALDGVQDPQNLGAIMRTAVSVGASAIITPRDRSVRLTPAAAKVAEGAAEHIPIIEVTNLKRGLVTLKDLGYWAVGFDMGGQRRLWGADFLGRTVIVLGGEGRGLRRLVRECCDDLVSIPMQGPIESLNVAAVAAVAMFEVVRQRESGSRLPRSASARDAGLQSPEREW